MMSSDITRIAHSFGNSFRANISKEETASEQLPIDPRYLPVNQYEHFVHSLF